MRRFIAALAIAASAAFFMPAAHAQNSVSLTPTPVQHFVDNNGVALSGGQLFTYSAGTTTKLSTFTDSTGATPNTDPVILNSRGEANVWLGGGSYKFVLSPANDSDPPTNPIWTVDGITGGGALGIGNLVCGSTVDLGSVGASSIIISGTGSVSSFGTTAPAGTIKNLTFSGSCTIVFNAVSMITPTGSNITTQAGATAIVQALGSGNWQFLSYQAAGGTGSILNAVNFGADPSGVNDNSVALQTIYTNACNQTVFFPAGTYKFTSVVGTVHCWVNLQGSSSLDTTFDYSSIAGAGPFLTITGSVGTSTLLTSGVNLGTSTLLLTSATGFTSNQYVYVSSSAVCCSHYSPPGIIGEISYIDTLSGTTATLRGVLADTYKLVDGAYAAPLTMLGPGFISGIHFKGPAADQHLSGVEIQMAHNVKVLSNWFDNAGDEHEFEIAACWQCEVAHNQFSMFNDPISSRDSYSLGMDGTVQDADVHDNQFFGYGTVDVGYGAAAGPPLSGIARRIHFHHNQLYAATAGGNQEGFETHGACEDVRVEDNTFWNSSRQGVLISCWQATVRGNSINYPTFVGIMIENLSDRVGRIAVNDNYINTPLPTNGYGINISQGVLGTLAPYNGLQIERNRIINSGTGITFPVGNTASTGIDIIANVIDNPGNGASANCISIVNLRDVNLRGNSCLNLSTAVSTAIFTLDIKDMNEADNLVALPSASSATGIANTGTSSGSANQISIYGNKVVGFSAVASRGIANDNNVTFSTIGVNDVSQTTTPITAGTGTGNIIAYPIFGTTSASIGGSPLSAGVCASSTAPTIGSLPSMVATAVPNTYPGDTIYWRAVPSTNFSTVYVCSATGSTPTSSTYNVSVTQ